MPLWCSFLRKIFHGKIGIKDINLPRQYLGNILTLLKGTSLSQLIPIIVTPIIVRLYSAEQIGSLAVFIALSSILATFLPLGYEQAIMLPQSKRRTLGLVRISVFGIIVMSLVSYLGISFFKAYGIGDKFLSPLDIWLWAVPISAVFLALSNVFNVLNLKMGGFKTVSTALVIKFTTLAGIQILGGLLKPELFVLVLARIFGNILQFVKLAKNKLFSPSRIGYKNLVRLSQEYRKFPLFNIWGALANIIGLHMVTLLISYYYTQNDVGAFAVIQRVLVFPLALFSQAIGQVYYKAVVKEKIQSSHGRKTIAQTIAVLLVLSIVIFVPLYFVGGKIVLSVFGEKWASSASFVKILIPLFVARFIANPISHTLNAFQKQQYNLLWQVAFLFTVIGIFAYSNACHMPFYDTLQLYSLGIALMYLFQLGMNIKVGFSSAS